MHELRRLELFKLDRIFVCSDIAEPIQCVGPYHVESTSSRPITEVKQHWATLVLGWVTAWEYEVLYSLLYSQETFATKIEQYGTYSLVF